MLRLFVFSLFIAVVCAAGSSTTVHTQTYEQWKAGVFDKTFFLPNTFLDKHRCLSLSEDGRERRQQYLELLEAEGIQCTGDWCIDGEFRCPYGNSKSCYNMEHIIDIKNSMPALAGWNKNIVGNIIMAYGKWNQDLGSMRWDNVESEKREIYGNDIVNRAMLNIQFCHEEHPTPNQDDVDENDAMPEDDMDMPVESHGDLSTEIGFGVGGLVLVALCVGLYLAFRYGKVRTSAPDVSDQTYTIVEEEPTDEPV